MRIVVATDLSARSDRALERGFQLALEHRAKLRVLHVVDGELPKELRDHTVDWASVALQRETRKLSTATDVTAEVTVTVGDPPEQIVRIAENDEADLLVLGLHQGERTAQRGYAESTAGRVLKSSLTAALIVKSEVSDGYRNLIVGVDFSMLSKLALRQAAAFAPVAHIHIVRAFHVPFKGWLGSPAAINEIRYRQRLEIDDVLGQEMADLRARASEFGVLSGSVSTLMEEGEPLEVLRAVQRRLNADLLVIATHGRGFVSRAIWGSVASDLLGDPPCDILVIRPY